MTTRTQTKMAPKVETVYIAEDGTEFPTANLCRFYEDELQRKRGMETIASIETCDELQNYTNFDGGWFCDEDHCTY